MPPINPVLATAGVIALSMAVATAIAVYESPEVRRMADDLRRRIAIALQSLSENIAPNANGMADSRHDEPLFNRPEDADGFLMSSSGIRSGNGNSGPDVVADEDSRRRQREELLYWNRVRLENQQREEAQLKMAREIEQATREAAAAAALAQEQRQSQSSSQHRKTSFDSFMRPDRDAAKGTFVINTAFQANPQTKAYYGSSNSTGLSRRRQWTAPISNPFGDEHGIEMNEHEENDRPTDGPFLGRSAYLAPSEDTMSADIYNASEPDTSRQQQQQQTTPRAAPMSDLAASEVFFDAADPAFRLDGSVSAATARSPATLVGDMAAAHQNMEDSQHSDAYSSIQAWAQNSTGPGFYSPLPATPTAPMSEPEVISTGQLTPTDSMSVVSESEFARGGNQTGTSSVTVGRMAEDVLSSRSGVSGRPYYDLLSDDEASEGLMTPSSWTEVGSVVSESDAGATAAVHSQ